MEPITQIVNPRKLTYASRLVTVNCRGCDCITDHVKQYYVYCQLEVLSTNEAPCIQNPKHTNMILELVKSGGEFLWAGDV